MMAIRRNVILRRLYRLRFLGHRIEAYAATAAV
jgi:hypothetical protein